MNEPLEEFADTFIRDRLPFVLIANQAHSIAEKCRFVQIGEPQIQRVLGNGRAPVHDHMVMGHEYAPVRVSRPTVIQFLLVQFEHLRVRCCENISLVNHHRVNDNPD